MGELDLRLRRLCCVTCLGRCHVFHLPADLLGCLVFPQPFEGGMAKVAIAGPATKLDFRDKLWLDVVKIAPGKCCQLLREGTSCLRLGF